MHKSLRSPLVPLVLAGIASLYWLINVSTLFGTASIDSFYHIDLDVYREGGRALVRGENLYDQGYELSAGFSLPFTYPPFAAALFASLSWLPLPALSVLVTVASVAALWISLYAVISRGTDTPQPILWASWALLACLATESVTQTLYFGQVNLLLTAAVVVDCLLVRRRSPWRGVLTGIAMAIKLTPAVFLAVFFVRRDWRALATAVATFISCGLLGFLVAPDSSATYWASTLRDSTRIGRLEYAGNQSLHGVLSRIAPEHADVLWLVGCVLIVAALWWIMEHTASEVVLVLLASSAALLCSPVSWSHHFTYLSLAAAYLVVQRRWCLAALAWVALLARGHWLVPHNNQLELTWAWWQHLPGNDYFIVTAVLVAASAVARIASSTRSGGARRAPLSAAA